MTVLPITVNSIRSGDTSDDDTTAVNADSDPDRFFAATGEIGIESFQFPLQIVARCQGLVRVIILVAIHSKERHKTVAKEFVDHSSVFDFHDLNHCM